MERFDTHLITTTAIPINRKQLRIVMNEKKRLDKLLITAGNIIEESIKAVNEAEDEIYQQEVYLYGLNVFNAICDIIEHVKRPKYWKINRRFYVEVVKPVK